MLLSGEQQGEFMGLCVTTQQGKLKAGYIRTITIEVDGKELVVELYKRDNNVVLHFDGSKDFKIVTDLKTSETGA
jgi:hypothetical protein